MLVIPIQHLATLEYKDKEERIRTFLLERNGETDQRAGKLFSS